jgi:hypothetical protein
MSNFYVYSVEPMPRVDLFAKRDYSPDNDYIHYNGIHLAPIDAKTWTRIDDRFKSLRHHDRTDRQGHTYHVFADEIVKANRERLGPRGVVFTDHEPSATEKLELEKLALERNLQFRLETIQHYEDQVREHETGNPARTKPTSYELECYEVLGMERPYSVAAFKSQRDPGGAAANRFAEALEKLVAHLGAGGHSAQKAAPKPTTTTA